MEKLENLTLFNEKKLSQEHKSQILGGAAPVRTQAGTRCTAATSTGCQSYASDTSSPGVTTYDAPYAEVGNPCTPVAPGTGGGAGGAVGGNG